MPLSPYAGGSELSVASSSQSWCFFLPLRFSSAFPPVKGLVPLVHRQAYGIYILDGICILSEDQ